MNTLAIPSAEEIKDNTEQDLKDSQEASDFVEGFTVSSDDDLRSAVAILKEIKTKYNEIEFKRTNFTKPLNKVLKELNATFKPALDSLKKAEKAIKQKVSACVDMRLDARESVLEKLSEAPEDKRDDMLARADELVPPDIDGLSIYYQWTGEMEDEEQVIDWLIENDKKDLLDANTKGLESLTKAKDGDVQIPGWKPVKKPVVRIGTK